MKSILPADSHALPIYWRLLLVIGGLLLARISLGQSPLAAPPPGGYKLRSVQHLQRVAEPPGGLIPYRQGILWGYADTTGRVVIQPCLGDSAHRIPLWETVFFRQGFALLPDYTRVTLLPTSPDDSYRAVILNARGEMLRIDWSEAALLLPDSSLQRVPRWQVYGQWEWGNTRPHAAADGFSRGGPVRIVRTPRDEPSPPTADRTYYEARLVGANRAVRANHEDSGAQWVLSEAYRVPRKEARFALTNLRGRRLTSYRFALVDEFHDGVARVILPAWPRTPTWMKAKFYIRARPKGGRGPWGYIDTTGQLLPLPPLAWGANFRHGLALVQDSSLSRYAIIDTKGNFHLPWQSQEPSRVDEAGFVRVHPTGDAPETYKYLPPPGKKGFAALFDYAGPFRNGRARVRQGARWGLIDTKGRWITPRAYDLITAPRQLRFSLRDAREEQLDERMRHDAVESWRTDKPEPEPVAAEALTGTGEFQPLADTAYLVVRRQGAYGIVARRTGRETVSARYDSVLLNPCGGIACLLRDGQAYVVNVASGRELTPGYYRGVDFITPHGRLVHVTRPEPAAWALFDVTGKPHTPWLAGTGYPVPGGWLLSHEPSDNWTIRDSTGRLGFSSPLRIQHLPTENVWKEVNWTAKVRGHETATYWRLPLPQGLAHVPSGPGFVVAEPQVLRWLDVATLREVGHLPTAGTTLLRNGWGHRPDGLLSPTGQFIPSDVKAPWPITDFDYPGIWRRYGVLPTGDGYRTRGGRNLWR